MLDISMVMVVEVCGEASKINRLSLSNKAPHRIFSIFYDNLSKSSQKFGTFYFHRQLWGLKFNFISLKMILEFEYQISRKILINNFLNFIGIQKYVFSKNMPNF